MTTRSASTSTAAVITLPVPVPGPHLDDDATAAPDRALPVPADTSADLGGPADDLTYLASCGLTRAAIARQASMNIDTLTRAADGRRLAPRTVAVLRGVRVAWTPPPGHVLAVPGVRRLQAMAFIGHTPAAIAAELDQPTLLVWEWTTGEHRFLPAPAAAAIDRLYRTRCLTPGPNPEIAAYARSRRWVSALAWDDDTLDDLWAQPDLGRPGSDHIIDPIAVELALAGRRTVSARLTSRERHTAIRLGLSRGLSSRRVAALLGCSERQVAPGRAGGRDRAAADPFVAYYRFADLYAEAA